MVRWTPDGGPPGDVVFLREEHLPSLVLEIEAGDASPTAVFKVTLDVEPHLELVSALLRADDYEQLCATRPLDLLRLEADVARFSPLVGQFVARATTLVAHARNRDADNAVAAARSLRDVVKASKWTPAIDASIPKLLLFIEEAARTGFRLLTWPGLNVTTAPLAGQRKWWRAPVSSHPAFTRLKQRFDATVNGYQPDAVTAVRMWAHDIEAALAAMHAPSGGEGGAFRAASAFFAALCEHRLDTREPVLALLSLHRAWEWFLSSICADDGGLDFSQSHVLVHHSGEKVGFESLLDEINRVDATPVVGVGQDLDALNRWRNLLVYTHHLTTPEEAQVRALAGVLLKALKARAPKSWRTCYTAFAAPFPISIDLLLDPDGALRAGVTLATAADLDPVTHGLDP